MMNGYLIFILAVLIGGYLLEGVTDLLTLRSIRTSLPEEFAGVYDPEKYRTSMEYQREGLRFELFRRTVFLVATLAFILLGGFAGVDRLVRSTAWGPIPTGLLYLGALGLLRSLLALPFTLYDTFVIEEKYGFNRTTIGTFVADTLKGLLLAILFGAPIFAGILYFFEKAGPSGWLLSWAIVTVFQLVLSFVAPVLILPLFNKFSPLPDGNLKSAIERYAATQNFQLQGIFTMDSSKRSTKSNAFFTGFGRFRRLVLFDTLVQNQTVEELVAVLAHEIGHFKCRHIPQTIALSIATTGLMFYVLGLFMNNPGLFAAFGMENLSVYASLVFTGFIYAPLLKIIAIAGNGLSRKFEFEADAFAVKTYGRPEDLVSALKKLSIDNLSNLTPHPLKVFLDYTHPPVLQRIAAIRR